MTGSTLVSSLVALLCVLLPLCAAGGSCRGRCGKPFAHGICNCDYNCFVHSQCCKDFEEVCTSSSSCRGRCGEQFLHGRECYCHSDCVLSNNCCSDYHGQCDAFSNLQGPRSSMLNKPTDYTEQCMAACLAQQSPDHLRDGSSTLDRVNTFMAPPDAPLIIAGSPVAQIVPMNPSDVPGIGSNPSGFPLPDLVLASGPGQADRHSSMQPLINPVQASLSINGQGGGPFSGPASGPGGPSTLEDIVQAIGGGNPAELDANSKPDICSSLPIDGLATLFNGTIIVFKGHHFWLLNPKTRRAGPARSITEELGIPSPIDTAFTRCNCQGKTYIIKGDNYWIFENGVMESRSPRSVSEDFGGLTGEISAALSLPAARKKPEIVYFFKKDGTVQKLTYPSGSAPCSARRNRNSVYAKIRSARQAGMQLSRDLNINVSWKGFPTPVTSALSMPKKQDGFDYLVFSWPKVFNIKITGDLPTLASGSSQQNEIRSWLNCPKDQN